MTWIPAYVLAITLLTQPVVTGLLAHMPASRQVHRASTAERDEVNLPIEPPLGTLDISSDMTTVIATGAGDVGMMLDLNSACTWWPDVRFTCTNGITGAQNTQYCNPDFHYTGGGSFVAKDYSQPTVNCAYWDRDSSIHGTYVEGILVKGNLTVAGFDLLDQRILFAESFFSNFSASSDADMRHVLSSSSSGVLGLGLPNSLYQGNTYQSTQDLFNGILHNMLVLPAGTAPVNVMTVAMPRGSATGKIVIGGRINMTTLTLLDKVKVPAIGIQQGHMADKKSANWHAIPVDWLGPPEEYFSANSSSAWSADVYLIDSMTDVIWTNLSTAAATAALFTPPATPNWVGDFIVNCNASLPSDATVSLGINGTNFQLDREDLIVHRADGTCVSAVQARLTNGMSRLGWPFLKNVVLFFDSASIPGTTSIEITARAASSSGQQVSSASASSIGTTTALTTCSTFSTSTTQAPE